MIRKTLIASALVGMSLAGSAYAEVKIATVNFQRLMSETNQAKATSQVLQDEFGSRQRDLQQRSKDLQTKQDKLTRDGAVMAEKEKSALEKEISKGQRDLQADAQSFEEEANTRQNEEGAKLQALLVNELQTFAKNGGYDLILPSSVAVFTKDSLDVTSQVITFLQSRPATAAAPAAAAPATKSGTTKATK